MQSASALSREALFARLAAEPGVTVVTPNTRLAHALARDYDAAREAEGLLSWPSPDVIPFEAFVRRCWEDALQGPGGGTLPVPISAHQEQALWEEAIGASPGAEALLSVGATAARCREAWDLAHAWQLIPRLAAVAQGEDARAFVEWSGRFRHAVEQRGVVEAARLAAVVGTHLAAPGMRLPRVLVLYAFDLLTPRQEAFLVQLQAAGVAIAQAGAEGAAVPARRVVFTERREELRGVARWARARLEAQPGARIGIVVPDLARSRAAIARELARVLHPAVRSPEVAAFELSLGAPLAAQPLVKDALLVLRLCGRHVPYEDASRVLRSPFLAGAEAEHAPRAVLDARLRRRAAAMVTLDGLCRQVEGKGVGTAVLAHRLQQLAEHRRGALFSRQPASAWARGFEAALRIAGFPGERGLDSPTHQAFEKWHALLAAFAALDLVRGRMGHEEACAALERMARETPYQPEGRDAPVQVMGILESAGLAFDHLWVLGMRDDAWPMPARPEPLLPVALQRAAGIPQADAGLALALDRRLTEGWCRAAGEVVFSHATMEGDAECMPSPLVAVFPMVALEELAGPEAPTLAGAMRGTAQLERVVDARGTPLAAGEHAGGTGLFRDQAACPFRAFARRRLGSESLEAPAPGLEAKDRGTLAHEMMRATWARVGGSAALEALDAAALEALLQEAASEALQACARRLPETLEGRYRALEHARLVSLAREWLARDRARAPFRAEGLEESRPLTFGGVTVQARLDRRDVLDGGGTVVIDYKSGNVAVRRWLGPRPDEPQLPMYALALGAEVRAVAFAKLAPGEREYCGVAAQAGVLPGVRPIEKNASKLARPYADWEALRAHWAAELETLGREWLAGEARVAPKKDACAQCEQHAFCRVDPRKRAAEEAE